MGIIASHHDEYSDILHQFYIIYGKSNYYDNIFFYITVWFFMDNIKLYTKKIKNSPNIINHHQLNKFYPPKLTIFNQNK